ncbi:MAB_1171c family putative transporter [Streptomyces sp. NPDC093225]|uniref:MAB_1171c family putative transporter n=1 Tax=Streptomyces sp. NPDC093225 TaxID=3366034 RepID=UPI003813E8A8
MLGSLHFLTGLIALTGAACRIWFWRGGRPHPESRYLVAFTVAIGLAMLLLPFTRVPATEPAGPLRTVLPLVGTELKLAAEAFLALLAHTVRYGGARVPHVLRQATASVLVMACAAVLYRAAGAVPAGTELTAGAAGRPALAGYDLLFTVHSLWCTGLLAVVVHRSAGQLGPSPLRSGLRLVVAGAVAGFLWSAWSVELVVDGLRTGHHDIGVNSAPLALVTIVLSVAGMTLTAWGGRLGAPARWLRARRSHRRIAPLWAALHAARPEIAFAPAAVTAGSPGFALYRRVIEIRDAQLALRVHVHPAAARWAVAACPAPAGSPRRAATVEAAELAAALEAAAVGHRYPRATGAVRAAAAPPVPGAPVDLEAEAARLVLVCEAFTDSPAVAAVRARVRAELTATPPALDPRTP